MNILKLFFLICSAALLVNCGKGASINNPSSDDPSSSSTDDEETFSEWEFGETVELSLPSSAARRTLETLGTDLGLSVNQFESLSINLELQTIVVADEGQQQHYQGDLNIGWISDGQFQEIKARAETVMMQTSVKECSWWKGCTVLFNESNEAKRHSYGKGASLRLIFEILDPWGADYDLMGGAFIFYGHERGDNGTMQGSLHYLPPYCPGGGDYINGVWHGCGEKSLHQHCWLLKAGPYQCHTSTLSPSSGASTYQVHHCTGGGAKYDKKQRRYICKKRTIQRNYTRLGSFNNFNILDAQSDYFASLSTTDLSRGLASVENASRVWMFYLMGGFFVLVIAVVLTKRKSVRNKRN